MKDIILPEGAEKFTKIHRTEADYQESLHSDFENMLPYLPENVETVLDIGCGLGGIDVLLQRHYPGASFILMDGTGDAPRKVGYGTEMEPFNDMALTMKTMYLNGVQAVESPINPNAEIQCDLVISLLSWCWHYPADVYMSMVKKSDPEICIVDCRAGHPEPFLNGKRILTHTYNRGWRTIYGIR